MKGVDFLDGNDGWVAVSSPDPNNIGSTEILVLGTRDAGQSWSSTEVGSSAAYTDSLAGPAYIDFVDPKVGWLEIILATGSGSSAAALFSTEDGGATWRPETIPVGGPITFANSRVGWVADSVADGKFFVTSDGGRSWKPAVLAPPQGFEKSEMIVEVPQHVDGSPMTVTATFIGAGSSSIAAYSSTDGGQTWPLLGSTSTGAPSGDVADPTSVLATGDIVASSVDGSSIGTIGGNGLTTGPIQSEGVPAGQAIETLSFVDRSDGWAITEGGTCLGEKTGCTEGGSLLSTNDGGQSWVTLPVASA